MNSEELVELCKAGDRQALDWLYKTYADRMLQICFYYVADRQIAQDLLHDGFIIIISSLHALRSPDKLESWMGTIMRNLSIRYARQHVLSPLASLEDISEEEQPVEPCHVDVYPTYAELLGLIEKLPDGYGRIFRLSVLEGLSHKEIGLLLNIAPHSSSSQLARAKAILRRLISQYRVKGFLLLFFFFSVVNHYQNDRIADEVCTNRNRENVVKAEKIPMTDMTETDTSRTVISPRYDASVAHVETGQEDVVRKDSMVRKDCDNLPSDKEQNEDTGNSTEKKHYRILSFPALSSERSTWTLAFSCSGGETRTHVQVSRIPGSITSGDYEQVTCVAHHYSPAVFSLLARKMVNERWGMEIGLQYTFLRTDFTTLGDVRTERVQRLHYVGIPFRGTFNVWSKGRCAVYASAGVTLDIPVKATVEESFFAEDLAKQQKWYRINPSWQWSASLSVGLHYRITPTVGLFAEPGLYYYFNPGERIRTVRTDHPFRVVLPVGLRFSW